MSRCVLGQANGKKTLEGSSSVLFLLVETQIVPEEVLPSHDDVQSEGPASPSRVHRRRRRVYAQVTFSPTTERTLPFPALAAVSFSCRVVRVRFPDPGPEICSVRSDCSSRRWRFVPWPSKVASYCAVIYTRESS